MVDSRELISKLWLIKLKLDLNQNLKLNQDEKLKFCFIENIISAVQRRMKDIRNQIDFEFNETCSNINFKLMNNQNLKKQDELYLKYLNIYNKLNNNSLIEIIEGLILAVENGDCLTFSNYYEIENLIRFLKTK